MPRFEHILGAGLAIAAAAHSPEARAEDTSAEMSAMAQRLDERLEAEHDGMDFEVNAYSHKQVGNLQGLNDPGVARIDYRYRAAGEGMWRTGEQVEVSRARPMEERESDAMQQIDEAIEVFEADQARQREIVEEYHISGPAQDLIIQMGGDPFSRLGKQGGAAIVELKLSNKKTNGYLYLDETTASADIEMVQKGKEKVLQVSVVNEDGSRQVAQWDSNGNFLGVK